ncbi:hypothetical protein QTG54_013093 [Skeletonema marinoi]|uniref:Uncharacterized protein n=1 Tax=Skeletonema marinoi TaxID=267567 RepID=A0AAD9D6Q0_9STRA|nr:hypothetical protein QTG54_013093 [Skeletonema marinoi]
MVWSFAGRDPEKSDGGQPSIDLNEIVKFRSHLRTLSHFSNGMILEMQSFKLDIESSTPLLLEEMQPHLMAIYNFMITSLPPLDKCRVDESERMFSEMEIEISKKFQALAKSKANRIVDQQHQSSSDQDCESFRSLPSNPPGEEVGTIDDSDDVDNALRRKLFYEDQGDVESPSGMDSPAGSSEEELQTYDPSSDLDESLCEPSNAAASPLMQEEEEAEDDASVGEAGNEVVDDEDVNETGGGIDLATSTSFDENSSLVSASPSSDASPGRGDDEDNEVEEYSISESASLKKSYHGRNNIVNTREQSQRRHVANRTPRDDINAEIDVLVKQFNALNCGQCVSIPIAREIRLLELCKMRLADELTRGELRSRNIHHLVEMYRDVIGGTDECRKEFATIERKKADILEGMPQLSVSQSRGELLTSLARTAKVDYKFLLSNVEESSVLCKAVHQFLGNDARGNERKLTATALKEFSIHSHAVKNCLAILANLSTAVDVLEEFLVKDLGLDDEFITLASNLYQEMNGGELDAAVFNTLELIETIILPHLKNGTCVEKMVAVKLLLEIKERVLYVKGASRRDVVLGKFRAAASKSVSVGEASRRKPTDYFDNRNRRSAAMHVLFCLLMTPEIEAKLPTHFFDEHGGLALRVLGLSWTNLTALCLKFGNTSFFDVSSEQSFRRVSTEDYFSALQKTDEHKTKVVFFNRRQVDSLQALARLHSD